jgi:hypothetical protein
MTLKENAAPNQSKNLASKPHVEYIPLKEKMRLYENEWDLTDFARFNRSASPFAISLFSPIACIDAPMYSVNFGNRLWGGCMTSTLRRFDSRADARHT